VSKLPLYAAHSLTFYSRFVALKILTAEATEGSREAKILRSLSPQNDNEDGRYVVCLLDDFYVEGPNGKHQVLVTEVLASISSIVRQANSPKLVKQFCRQAILGLAFLHSRGIAHGGTSSTPVLHSGT
jgi:serine/threonine-protein kinase SRPK3